MICTKCQINCDAYGCLKCNSSAYRDAKHHRTKDGIIHRVSSTVETYPIFKNKADGKYYASNCEGEVSNPHDSLKSAKEECYVRLAYDYGGAGIRDNSKADKIAWGKMITKGHNPFDEE